MVDLVALERIAREEYADIVLDAYRVDAKLRVVLTDESYLDFWWSEVEQGRFAHHWNRQHVDGTIHRHDNSPHRKWRHVETFPQHYHREREDAVTASFLPTEPREAVRAQGRPATQGIRVVSRASARGIAGRMVVSRQAHIDVPPRESQGGAPFRAARLHHGQLCIPIVNSCQG